MLGYTRASTAEQAVSGIGLAAQEHAIREECARRGWVLERVVRDEGASGGSLDRVGLRDALEDIADGHADGLLVARLDRLSRSVGDFATLLDWFDVADATLVAIDLGIDTSTPGGKLVANVFASVAQWEREVIAARTRDGLAVVRSEGRPISGPTVSDDAVLMAKIEDMRATGTTYRQIAVKLNEEGIPTLRGGACWRASSLQRILSGPRPATRRKAVTLPEARRAPSGRRTTPPRERALTQTPTAYAEQEVPR